MYSNKWPMQYACMGIFITEMSTITFLAIHFEFQMKTLLFIVQASGSYRLCSILWHVKNHVPLSNGYNRQDVRGLI